MRNSNTRAFFPLGIKWLVLVLTAAMVLDHLEIGGVVAELAFGILFGGIVPHARPRGGASASRDPRQPLTRKPVERSSEHGVAPPDSPTTGPGDSHPPFLRRVCQMPDIGLCTCCNLLTRPTSTHSTT